MEFLLFCIYKYPQLKPIEHVKNIKKPFIDNNSVFHKRTRFCTMTYQLLKAEKQITIIL